MDNSLIGLDPYNAAVSGQIDLTQDQPKISDQTAQSRADKVSFGLGPLLGKSTQDLYDDFTHGRENSVRQEAAAKIDQNNLQYRDRAVQQLASIGHLTPESFSQVNPEPTNPNSVFEHAFADSWMYGLNKAGINLPDSQVKNASPEVRNIASHIGTEAIAKHQMMATAWQDLNDYTDQQGFASKTLNYLKGFIPFYNEYKLRGNVEGVGTFAGLGLGENLEQATSKLLLEPLPQFSKDFPRVMDYLKNSDPDLAIQFLSAMYGQTSQDKYLQDLFTGINVASVLPIGSVVKAVVGRTANQVAVDAAEDMTRAAFKTQFPTTGEIPKSRALTVTSNMPTEYPLSGILDKDIIPSIPTKAVVSEAAGDVKSAAIERVMANVEEDQQGKANPTRRALERLTDNGRLDQTNLGEDAGSLSREQTARLQDQYEKYQNRFIDLVTRTMRAVRVPLDQAKEDTIKAIQNSLKDKYPGLSNRVFNITKPIYEPVSNVWFMGTDIGDVDGGLFASEQQARRFANFNDIKDYEIRRQGHSFWIRTYRSLDENTDPMRDLVAQTGINPSRLKNAWNAALGWFRTPEDTMSKHEMEVRKTATYPQANFRRFADEEAQAVKDMANGRVRQDPVTGEDIPTWKVYARSWSNKWSSRQAWKEWKRVLAASRDLGDVQAQKMGYTFKTAGEFERFFLSTVNRMPSFSETEAYFAKIRLDLFDWANRNMRVYTNKASRGAETWRIFAGDEEGKPTYSEKFDGIRVSDLPQDDHGIVISRSDNYNKELYFRYSREMPVAVKKEIETKIKTGQLKVIEVWGPEQYPLKGYGSIQDQRIRWVVAQNAENHALSWEQIPRRGGGHFDYDYPYYIKQAIIRRNYGEHWYDGDTTIMPVSIRKMGEDVAAHLNNIRLLLKQQKNAEAEAYTNQHLPIKHSEIKQWFESKLLDYDEPIQVVDKNALIHDKDNLANRYEHFRNGLREGSKNALYQVAYTGERDNKGLYTIEDKGTRNNPLYQYTPADLVDPITTMNRGLNRIVHSTFMDDYKIFAVENWLRMAEPYLAGVKGGAATKEEIRAAPWSYFMDTRGPKFRPNTDFSTKQNLMSNWYKIRQFLGTPSTFDLWLHTVEEKLQTGMYDALGPKGAVVPTWMLHHVKDPIQLMRKLVYHYKLGLFNPGQFLVQNQTWTNIYAISPRSAPAGSMATFMHYWGAFRAQDEEFLNALDTKAQKLHIPGFFRWKPGEWKEAFQTLLTTGFKDVEGEYAMHDAPMSHSFVGGDMKGFLNLGQMFFHYGVKNVRLGAWYTAFKEFRELHPTGALTRDDVQKILQKADTYHANMSRASSSMLNRGVFSLPNQFLTYQMRLTELFLGKRLGETKLERNLARFRMMATYSALYGIPAAVGLVGYPFGNTWRKAALDHGYVVGENYLTTAMNEGIPAWFTGMITGQHYNFGDRYGAHGLDVVKNALQEDHPWWEIMGGAAGTSAINTIDAATYVISSMADPDMHVTLNDWLAMTREITSVNQAWKVYEAAKFGEWLAKNEGLEAKDVPFVSAAFMGLTGLQPQEQDDQFYKGQILAERRSYEKEILRKYLVNIQRGFRAARDKDPDSSQKFISNAKALYDRLSPQQQRYAHGLAAQKSTIPDAVDLNFYLKQVPGKNNQQYLKYFQDLQRQKKLDKGSNG